MMGKYFLYLGVILAIIGLILLVAGTTTYTYPREQFSGVNGMYLIPDNTVPNYFYNFLGLAIFLFGLGGIISHLELERKGVNRGGNNG
jgi:hypothetical protein